MITRRLLLLSSSRDADGTYLLHFAAAIQRTLGPSAKRHLFLPYAGVTISRAAYAAKAATPFASLGHTMHSIDDASDPVAAVHEAEAIVIGGGNTFQLLNTLQHTGLVDAIRSSVHAGVPYIGWSAGAVVASPTIATTNDMPIVWPASLRSLGLIPFQINAHYTDFRRPNHQGETREERLEEYIAVNRTTRVVGLREGCSLTITDDAISLNGDATTPVFAHGSPRRDYTSGDDMSFLLRE